MNNADRLLVIGHSGRVNFRSLRDIYRIGKRYKIDLFHSHNFPGMLYSYPAAKLLGLPIVHTQHGRLLREHSLVINTIEKIMSKSVGQYVCVSEQLRRDARSSIGINEDKLTVIYNGIETANVPDTVETNAEGRFVIGSVGRLTSIKNYESLVRAFAPVRASFPQCRLEIVGGGECFDSIKELVEELSLTEDVLLHGYQLDVTKYLRAFNIFVLPSFSEGHSISLLEALSLKKVCIVSNVGGNPEIIEDGQNGFLFDPNDFHELAEKIIYVIERSDSFEINGIRKKARETVLSKFSSETMLERYDRLYRKMLER